MLMETVMWDCIKIRYSEKRSAQILKSIDRLYAVAYFVHVQVHSHSHNMCLATCSCLSIRVYARACIGTVPLHWIHIGIWDAKNLDNETDACFITWLHLHDTLMSSYVNRIYLKLGRISLLLMWWSYLFFEKSAYIIVQFLMYAVDSSSAGY